MLRYVAVSQSTAVEDQEGEVTASGIAVYQDHKLVDMIGDITPDAGEAGWLADRLNRLGVSTIHFHDVVEDYLAQR